MKHARTSGLILAAVVISASGCTSAGGLAAAGAASSSPASCSAQLAAWRAVGSADYLSAITDEMSAITDGMAEWADDLSAGSDTSTDRTQLDTTAGQLQSDAQEAQGKLPPSCVPGMRAADSAALADAVKAARGTEAAMAKAEAGKNQAAVNGLLGVKKDIAAGDKKFDAAVNDAQAFGGSG